MGHPFLWVDYWQPRRPPFELFNPLEDEDGEFDWDKYYDNRIPRITSPINLSFSSPNSASPVCSFIYARDIWFRMRAGLKLLEGNEIDEEEATQLEKDRFYELVRQQEDADDELREAIYAALESHDALLQSCKNRAVDELLPFPGYASDTIDRCDVPDLPHGLNTDVFDQDSSPYSLHYRRATAALVDRFVEFLGIPLPKGRRCHEFEARKFEIEICDTHCDPRYRRLYKAFDGLGVSSTPGLPVRSPMLWHIQGDFENYLVSALWYSGLEENEMYERMADLAQAVRKEKRATAAFLMKEPDIREKAVKLFGLCGHRC